MTTPCQAALEQEWGRKLSAKEEDGLKRLWSKAYARARTAGYAANDNAALRIGLDILEIEARRQKKVEDIQALMQVIAVHTAENDLRKIMAGLPEKLSSVRRAELAIESYLVGTNQSVEGARASVGAAQQARSDMARGALLADILDAGLNAYLTRRADQKFWHDVVRDIERRQFKSPPPPDPNMPPDAIKMAEILERHQRASREYLRQMGIGIASPERYIARQIWDQDKLRKVGRKQWIDDAMRNADWDRAFDGELATATLEERQRALGSAWDAASSGVHLVIGRDGERQARMHQGAIGTRPEQPLKESRLLWWKDANAWIEMQEKYADSHILTAIIDELDLDARRGVLIDKLGPVPRDTIAAIQSKLIAEHRLDIGDDNIDKLRPGSYWVSARMAQLDNAANVVQDVKLASIMGTIRNTISAASLGKLGLTALPDMANYAAAFKSQGRGFMSGLYEAFGNLFIGRGSTERRAAAMRLGAGLEGMMNQIRALYGGYEPGMQGRMSRAALLTMRLSGANWWDDTMRAGITWSTAAHMADLVQHDWVKLRPELRRELGAYGITESDWAIIQKAPLEEVEKTRILTIEAIRSVAPDGQGDAVAAKYSTFLWDASRDAVLEQGPRERVWMYGNAAPGTKEGEFMRTIFFLKGYTLAQINRVVGRHLYAHNGVDISGMTAIFIASTLLGYVSNVLTDFAAGKTPRSPDSLATWGAAITRGGGMPLIGDYMFGTANRFGQGPLISLLGPLAGRSDNLGEIILDAIHNPKHVWDERGDNSSKATSSLVGWVKGITPLANLWWLEGAINYAIIHGIQESLNPGYLRRAERKMWEQNRQEYLVRPSQIWG